MLQALASDGLAPRFLARLSKTGQPTVATWISGLIALAAVGLGGLNTERKGMSESLMKLLPETRIAAESEIIVRQPGENIADVIHAHSATADIVFLGLKEPPDGAEAEYAARLRELAEGLRTTIFVRNAGEFAGNLI